MADFETLDIFGYRGERVPNRFYHQAGETRHLALVFPGYRYGLDLPLLYYPTQLLRARGADVLGLDLAYSRDRRYVSAADPEKSEWLDADTRAACAVAMAQREYNRFTLIGKSLGTLAVGCLVETEPRLKEAHCIWLTPILNNERLQSQMAQAPQRGLVVVGTTDPYYQEEILDRLEQATRNPSLVIPNADHSLEIPGKISESIRILQTVMDAIDVFLNV